MIPVLLTLIVLAIHYVADWIVQTREDAANKSHSLRALTNHVATYTYTLLWGVVLFCIWFEPATFTYRQYIWHPISFVLINGILHWGTDYITSRINAANWAKKDKKPFWAGIGADQLIHQITLILTVYWLLT